MTGKLRVNKYGMEISMIIESKLQKNVYTRFFVITKEVLGRSTTTTTLYTIIDATTITTTSNNYFYFN